MLDDDQALQRPKTSDPFASDSSDIRRQLKEIQDQSFQQLREIYNLARGEVKQWSLASFIIGILGIAGIFSGAFVALKGNVPFSLLAAVASIISEAIAFLIFRQSHGSWKRLDEIYKEAGKRVDDTSKILQDELHRAVEILHEKDRVERASKFVSEMITDKETQNRLNEAIFWQIMGMAVKMPETPLPTPIQQLNEEVERLPPSD